MDIDLPFPDPQAGIKQEVEEDWDFLLNDKSVSDFVQPHMLQPDAATAVPQSEFAPTVGGNNPWAPSVNGGSEAPTFIWGDESRSVYATVTESEPGNTFLDRLYGLDDDRALHVQNAKNYIAEQFEAIAPSEFGGFAPETLDEEMGDYNDASSDITIVPPNHNVSEPNSFSLAFRPAASSSILPPLSANNLAQLNQEHPRVAIAPFNMQQPFYSQQSVNPQQPDHPQQPFNQHQSLPKHQDAMLPPYRAGVMVGNVYHPPQGGVSFHLQLPGPDGKSFRCGRIGASR